MKILVVDDEKSMADYLKSALMAECHEVDVAYAGNQALELAMEHDYDIILLDLMLPEINGKEICKTIREEGKTVPIIILSVKGDVEDKVSALHIGADDYLEKPFSIHELTARIQAIRRRPTEIKSEIINIDDLKIDTLKRRVSRASKDIKLTNTEFGILVYLAENSGAVISKEKLFEKVRDKNADIFSNSINVHIFNLRKKIDHGHKKKLLHTVQGQGYKIELIKN